MRNYLFGTILSIALCSTAFVPVHAATSSMSATASQDEIEIKVSNVGKSGEAQLYAYDANDYFTKDKISGIVKKKHTKGTLVGTYTCGTTDFFSRDRYDEEGRDLLYQKYYLVKNKKILKGPIYVSKISSLKKKIAFKQKTIKGLFNENSTNMKYAKDLGVSSITVNIDLASIIYANEDPQGNPYTIPENAIEFTSNGKKYYFNEAVVKALDKRISAASKNHMNVIGVAAAWQNFDMSSYPSAMRYKNYNYALQMGTNTSNKLGRDYYIAEMEFLAHRYSQNANTGLISTYVIGNEIDFTSNFYASNNLNTFMEEYSRSLRLANLAVKKYAADINVAVPTTHYWTGDQKKIGKEGGGYSLKPYDMFNWLAKYSKARGNYNWALALHNYASLNVVSNVANVDGTLKQVSGNYKKTHELTFSNFEVLQAYLSQSKLRYGKSVRSVYLTESGISSSHDKKKQLNLQGASLVQAYYKMANLSFVKSFNYYRLQDMRDEAKNNLRTGLLKENGKKKPAYTVYKYIDTKKSRQYADPYLKYISFKLNNKKRMSVKKGNIKSWKDTMTVFTSSYNWKKKYKAKAYLR